MWGQGKVLFTQTHTTWSRTILEKRFFRRSFAKGSWVNGYFNHLTFSEKQKIQECITKKNNNNGLCLVKKKEVNVSVRTPKVLNSSSKIKKYMFFHFVEIPFMSKRYCTIIDSYPPRAIHIFSPHHGDMYEMFDFW